MAAVSNSRRRSRALPSLLRERGCSDEDILDAFARVQRADFLGNGLAGRAMDNSALPIGHGQTTSQPEVIARMLELAWQPDRHSRVLEVGAGSGYLAALLSCLYDEVFAVERIRSLAVAADRRMQKIGYNKVRLYYADGKLGMQKHAPFDAIIVSAATVAPPQPLLDQLADGGRLVLPEKCAGEGERLVLYAKSGSSTKRTQHDLVAFVPLLKGLE